MPQVHTKDKLLGQSRSQHQSAVAERDQLRIELGKLGATFRDKQDVVDEQIAEVSGTLMRARVSGTSHDIYLCWYAWWVDLCKSWRVIWVGALFSSSAD